MQENWKAVADYEMFYEVSDFGRLRRIATPTGKPKNKIIAPHRKRTGYIDYWLYADGTKKRVYAHRIVWIAFNGAIPDKLEINHVNGVKDDNRLSNLELATKSWNAAHSFQVLKRPSPNYPSPGEKNGSAKLTEEKVREIRQLYADKRYYQYELAELFGVSQQTITLVVRRETWAHVK